MTITSYPFDPDRVQISGRLFPDELEMNPWTVFHGTSGVNSRSIEINGFNPATQKLSASDMHRVAAVFQRLKWVGRHQGGYAVLKSFSLDYDFKTNNSPIFFAETGPRALLYATKCWAGGEKQRALRHALADLEAFLVDEEIRREHQVGLERNYQNLVKINAHPSMLEAHRPTAPDLNWLRHELEDLQLLRAEVEAVVADHAFGVVYALAIPEIPPTGFLYSSMGVESAKAIAPSVIAAKIVVPVELSVRRFHPEPDLLLMKLKNGLIPAIRRAHEDSVLS